MLTREDILIQMNDTVLNEEGSALIERIADWHAALSVHDARFGDKPEPHRHDWIVHSQSNGATFATCSYCLTGVQLA